jgi:hypothetical protein
MTLPTGEIMFDRDGTYGVRTASDQVSVQAEYTQTDFENARNLGAGTFPMRQAHSTAYMFFPEPMDLHYFWFAESTQFFNARMHYSPDSGAPGTGTWYDWSSAAAQSATSIGGGTGLGQVTRANMAIGAGNPTAFNVAATDVRALRFSLYSAGLSSSSYSIAVIRLWGVPSDPTTFLQLWDPTLDQAAADDLFDLGSIERGSFAEVDFRIRNMHQSLSVNNVTLTTPNGFGTNAPHTHITFDDGGGFANPLNIGTIAAEALSSVITLRRDVGGGEALGGGLASLLLDGVWA